MGVAGLPTRFVGRDAELALLTADLEATVHRHPAAVFVAGETGVGKSRLLSELARVARDQEVPVLSGLAVDLGDNAPFWPFRHALRGFLRTPQHDWVLDALSPWVNSLAELVPGIPALLDRPHAGDGHTQATLDLLVQVLMALVGHRPLLVVLDDMHWSDQSSRLLLNYLLAIVTDEPLMLVVAYRDDVESGQSVGGLATELQRSRRARILTLGSLDRAAVFQFASGEERPLAEFVWERSGGNPFLMEEILRYVRESGVRGIPDTLRDLVRARTNALPEPVNAVLRALAVGDEPVSHRILAAVAELAEPDLIAALRTAVAAGIVRVDEDDDGYRLHHGIVKDVVEGDLLPGERLRLHRRHAEAIERFGDQDFRTTAALARHWECAKDWSRALSATIAAASDAEHAYGFAEAHEHLIRALALCERTDVAPLDRMELEEQAARMAHLAGDCDSARRLLLKRLAELPSGSDTTSARLYGELGCYLAAAGQLRESVEAHARAVALLPDQAPAEARVAVLAGYAEALADCGRYADSQREAARAVEIAGQGGLDQLRGRVLPTLGASLAHLGHADAGLAALSQGLRLVTATGGPDDVARAHVSVCNLLCGPLNRLDEGIASGRRALPIVGALGLSRTYGVQLQAIVANALFRRGDWAAASELVGEALAATPTGIAAIELRLARCRLLVGRGEFPSAEQELEVLTTLCGQTVGPRYQAPLLTLRAGLTMFQNRPDLAREYVTRGLEVAGHSHDDIWVLAPLVWHGLRAEAEARELPAKGMGPVPDRVELLRETMHQLARRSESAAPGVRASVLGYVRLCDAEVSRVAGDSDPHLWALAAATWEKNLHPYPAAYCRYHEAEALFGRRARAAGAIDALTKAFRTARGLGAVPLLRLVETLAVHAGATLPGADGDVGERPGAPAVAVESEAVAPQPSRDQILLARLTKRERLVLSALAEGRTNRQIARRLFISEKTVSVHVSHILAKLEVRTRVQAATVAQRTGGLPHR